MASIEWSGMGIKATAEGSGSITKAQGGSVISGVTDEATDFGWLSATAPPAEATAAPRGPEPTTASAEPTTATAEPTTASAKPEEQTTASAEPTTASAEPTTVTAEPEEQSAPPGLAPEEGITLTPELEKTGAEETTGLGETTGEPTPEPTPEPAPEPAPEEEGSGVVGSIREGFASLISGFSSEKSQSSDRGSVSEGTVTEARAPAKARSVMEPSTDYSQVVDNASPGRFSAPGWEEGSEGGQYYGEDYTYVEPAQAVTPARFKVKIPTSGYYTVYAWWSSAEGNSAATRFGVSTTSGVKWTEVNQQTDGGMWVRIGAYEMQTGDRYAVQVSPGSEGQGNAIADAVMIVSGTQVTPPEGGAGDATMSAMSDDSMRAASSDDSMKAAGGRRAKLKELVKVARWHIGTRYRSSPPNPCRSYRKEDCSCHTKVVFKELSGKKLPDDPIAQWRLGRSVSKSELRPGDLVFFKEGRSRSITHVGFYSGNGNIVHASGYWGKVVERPMKYVSGYSGAKRIKP
jgi:cell wall-associated NlpC family hydrolase